MCELDAIRPFARKFGSLRIRTFSRSKSVKLRNHYPAERTVELLLDHIAQAVVSFCR